MKISKVFLFLIFVLIGLSFPERVFYLMGTYLIVDIDEKKVYELYRYMKSIEEKLSDFIEDSEISLINKNAGIKPVRVSSETFEAIKVALEIAEKTEGAYDPTVGSYTVNFLRKKAIDKDKALALINYKDVVLNEEEKTVFLKKKGMALDLGGIGKGYALELAKRFIGLSEGFIALSGDLTVWGQERLLGIYNPINGGILLQAVNREDLCMSSSGNYRRKHILGEEGNLLQVTVVHKNCAVADALATALYVSRKKEKILKKFPDAGVLYLYDNGSLYMNDKFRKYFKVILFKYD